jgi:hypothetical protein
MKYCLVILIFILKEVCLAYQGCPRLKCNENLGQDVCYLHSGDSPTSYIKFSSCYDPYKICDFS